MTRLGSHLDTWLDSLDTIVYNVYHMYYSTWMLKEDNIYLRRQFLAFDKISDTDCKHDKWLAVLDKAENVQLYRERCRIFKNTGTTR